MSSFSLKVAGSALRILLTSTVYGNSLISDQYKADGIIGSKNRNTAHAHIAHAQEKGSKALRAALTQSGHASGKSQTYFGAVYHRLAGRRGKKRAAVSADSHCGVRYFVRSRNGV